MTEIEKMAKIVRGAKSLNGKAKKQAYSIIDFTIDALEKQIKWAQKEKQAGWQTLVKHTKVLIQTYREEKENYTYYSVSDTGQLSPGSHDGYPSQEGAEHRVKTLHSAAAAQRGKRGKKEPEDSPEEVLEREVDLVNELYEEKVKEAGLDPENVIIMREGLEKIFAELINRAGQIMEQGSGGEYDPVSGERIPKPKGQRGKIIKPNVDKATNLANHFVDIEMAQLAGQHPELIQEAIDTINEFISEIESDKYYEKKPSGDGNFHILSIYKNMLEGLRGLSKELGERIGKWEGSLLKKPSVKHLLNNLKSKLQDIFAAEDKALARGEEIDEKRTFLTEEDRDRKHQERQISQFKREEEKKKDWKLNKTDWMDTLKEAGPVNMANQGTAPLFNNQAINPPKKEEEEYEIIPDEKDFWRD